MTTVKEVQERKKRLGLTLEPAELTTPESRQTEGQAYIREREKLANQQMISSRQAAQILTSQNPETPESIAERQLKQQKATSQLQTAESIKNITARAGQYAGELASIGNIPTGQNAEQGQPAQATRKFTITDEAGNEQVIEIPATAEQTQPFLSLEGQKQRIQAAGGSPIGQFLSFVGLTGAAASPRGFGVAGLNAVEQAAAVENAAKQKEIIRAAESKGIVSGIRKLIKNNKIASGLISYTGVRTIAGKLSSNRKQKAKEFGAVTSTSISTLSKIIEATNKGQMSPTDANTMYAEEWRTIHQNERDIHMLSQSDLSFFLESNSQDEYVRVMSLIEQKPIFDAQLTQAILSPNPNIALSFYDIPEETPTEETASPSLFGLGL